VHLVVPPGGSFRETRRIELGPRVLTIGRTEKCDVHLDVPGVDDEHAKISEVALIAVGPDCAVGDVPLDQGQRRLIMPGDEIQIGAVVVSLEGNDPSIIPPPPDDAGENMAIGRTRMRGPKVRVVEGANFGDEMIMEEENRLYVIGRNPKCDLVLEDREVSREHLKLVRRGFQIFIQDQSSTRGSWLGRTSVYSGSTIEWARPRMLKVGATVLSLELPSEWRQHIAPPVQSSNNAFTPPPKKKKPKSDAPPANHDSTPPGPITPNVMPVPGASSPPPGHSSHPPPGHASSYPPPGMQPSNLAPMPSSPPPAHAPNRRAWKSGGPVIGKASGLLLLALAALTILGALFVVFSLME
jgi:pSer/pThr/pTyr-binding forkhead associated (FHA) protein